MAKITLQSVSKFYSPEMAAVSDINLTIEHQDFFVLLGPSGCGKTTILRMIAGLEHVTQGSISLNDCKINDLSPGKRNISMVFQNYALFPHLTVEQNIAFGLKIRKVPKDEQNRLVKEAAEILELSNYLKKKPSELSGGQRQRTALGRAIVKQPAVFLFDEPLSNLDAQLRSTMRSELTELHKKLQATIVYVTHDQVEAMTLGNRVCVLNKGRIQQIDTPQNIFTKPANIFVASFIGTPPMNCIPCTLTDNNCTLLCVFDDKDSFFLAKDHYCNERLIKNIDKRVYCGIRPGSFSLHKEICKNPLTLHCSTHSKEFAGDTETLYFTKGTNRFAAVFHSQDYSTEKITHNTLSLYCDPNTITLFDSKGIRIPKN